MIVEKYTAQKTNRLPPDKHGFPDVKTKELKDGSTSTTVLGTHSNLEHLLAYFDITVGLNLMSRKVEVDADGAKYGSYLDAAGARALVESECKRSLVPIGGKLLNQYIDFLANKNQYHPVRDQIFCGEWDGVDRLETLIGCFVWPKETLENPEQLRLNQLLIITWLISAVAAIHEKPYTFSSRMILTIVGPENVGKTAFFKTLAFKSEFFSEGEVLSNLDKDDLIRMDSVWVAELAELKTSKANMDKFKGRATASKTTIRLPYGVADLDFERNGVFCATSNSDDALDSDEENTRFGGLRIDDMDLITLKKIDIPQLWRQIKAELYDKGVPWHLSKADNVLLTKSNRGLSAPCEYAMGVRQCYNTDLKVEPQARSTGEIYNEIHIAMKWSAKPGIGSLAKFGRALTRLSKECEYVEKGGGKNGSLYKLPPLRTEYCVWEQS